MDREYAKKMEDAIWECLTGKTEKEVKDGKSKD